MPHSILLAGGTGYIGTHILTLLTDPLDTIVILDNLSNSSTTCMHAAETVACRCITHFCEGDLAAPNALHMLTMLFQRFRFTRVIHLAGLKSIPDCQKDPLTYYHTNITSTLNLLRVMAENNCKTLIFSSSATVYAPLTNNTPCYETSPIGPSNCYGRTKVACEDILRDVCQSDPAWTVVALRYFNPVGAHPSGTLGETPADNKRQGIMPGLCDVAAGRKQNFTIFGGNYDTPDGTPMRDYVHIMDLAEGHVAALEWLHKAPTGFHAFNLGTGKATSIHEMVSSMKNVTGRDIPCEMGKRRAGDLGVVFADVNKAANVLEWTARLNVENMCRDAWRWDRVQHAQSAHDVD